MTLISADRVKETTTTTGTGNVTLAGAATGFRSFGSVLSTNDTCYYAIALGAEWEVGLGTYQGSNVLARTSVLASSNAGAAVSFSAGSKDIFITIPADAAAQRNTLGLGSAALQDTGDFDPTGAAAAAQAASQPLDADLTAIAALATASFGRSLLTQASAPATLVTLGIEQITTVADADKTVAATDHEIAYTSITVTRTTTLPPSNSVNDGHVVILGDSSGSVTNAIRIILAADGSDTIQGAATTWISSPYGKIGVRKRGTTWDIFATANLYQLDVFTASGTYTKPIWAKKIDVELLSGGGGGGAGGKGPVGNIRVGGGSGGGSGFSRRTYDPGQVSSPVTVTIGAGGTGGASQATNSTNGANGTAGGVTSFGALLRAGGGGLAVGGGFNASGGTTGAAGTGEIVGASGNNASTTGGVSGVGASALSYAAPGGGPGGSIDGSETVRAGGAGGASGASVLPTANTGGAGGAINTNGNPGTDAVVGMAQGGGGGGGGGASKTTNAGNGGNGGIYGGGGGGGGAATDSVGNSGAGGNGAPGICIVRTMG